MCLIQKSLISADRSGFPVIAGQVLVEFPRIDAIQTSKDGLVGMHREIVDFHRVFLRDRSCLIRSTHVMRHATLKFRKRIFANDNVQLIYD